MPAVSCIADYLDRAEPEPMSGCYLWTGATTAGYAEVSFRGKTAIMVHRAIFEELNGPLEPGLWVLHKCDVKICINPAHLYAGTPKQNWADHARAIREGRHRPRTRKTHCKYGHDQSVHRRYKPDGRGFQCLACKRENYARRMAQLRETLHG